MKKICAILLMLIICVSVTACSKSVPAASNVSIPDKIVVETAGEESKSTVSVEAMAEKKVAPDVAYIQFGVLTTDKDAKAAQNANREKMNAMITALKSKGLADDDFKTTAYNTYPMYDYSDGKQRITGYEVSNTVEVTIKDIDAVGDIIDTGTEGGANQVYNIRFDVLDRETIINQALEEAGGIALKRAEALAAGSGLKVGSLVRLTYGDSGGYNDGGLVYEAAAADEMSRGEGTSISAGEITINVTVNAVYETKEQ